MNKLTSWLFGKPKQSPAAGHPFTSGLYFVKNADGSIQPGFTMSNGQHYLFDVVARPVRKHGEG